MEGVLIHSPVHLFFGPEETESCDAGKADRDRDLMIDFFAGCSGILPDLSRQHL
jgi:hypothetical protein